MSSKNFLGINTIKSISAKWKLFSIIIISIIVSQLLCDALTSPYPYGVKWKIWFINREASKEFRFAEDTRIIHWVEVDVPEIVSENYDYAYCYIIESVGRQGLDTHMNYKIIFLTSDYYKIHDLGLYNIPECY